MAIHANFVVKVKNARLGDIRKALVSAGIEVRSIAEIHREDVDEAQQVAQEETES